MPNTVALVLASWTTSKPAPIKAALAAAAALNPLLINLVTDESGRSSAAAKLALEDIDDPRIVFTLVRESDTGYRWGAGVRATLRLLAAMNIECDRLVMIPGDIDKQIMNEADPGSFERLVSKLENLPSDVDNNDFVVCNYDIPYDPVKEEFDNIFTNRLFAAGFPDEWEENIKPLNATKLRGEFWAIRLNDKWREFLDEFAWPCDPTPKLIMHIIREGGTVGVRNLGNFQDEDENRAGHLNKAAQGIRLYADFVMMLANDVRWRYGGKDTSAKDQREHAERLCARLQLLFDGLRDGLADLDQRLLPGRLA